MLLVAALVGRELGEGVAVLDASWGGYDEALTVGAGIYSHGWLWENICDLK